MGKNKLVKNKKNEKKTVSNKTIFFLLVAALIITVIGTGVSVFKVADGNFLITGAVTDTGTTSVTVTSTTSITNRVPRLNFGSGYVNSSVDNCSLLSDGNSDDFTTCVSFSNVTQGFLIENTGNTNVTLNWTCAGNCTAANLIGGTNPRFEIRMTAGSLAADQSNQQGANDTKATCAGNLLGTTFADVSSAGGFICGNGSTYPFPFNNSADAVLIDYNLTLPEDATAGGGQKNATFTFTGTASG